MVCQASVSSVHTTELTLHSNVTPFAGVRRYEEKEEHRSPGARTNIASSRLRRGSSSKVGQGIRRASDTAPGDEVHASSPIAPGWGWRPSCHPRPMRGARPPHLHMLRDSKEGRAGVQEALVPGMRPKAGRGEGGEIQIRMEAYAMAVDGSAHSEKPGLRGREYSLASREVL